MKKSNDPQDIDEKTSVIVRIAYRQSREISGCENPNDSTKPPKDGFACTQRLMSLPIIASINSGITGAYTSVKESNSTVETLLKRTEEGLTEGAKIVSPVTSKIGETLEEPLKSIDSVICDGLDYLEEKVPSVKLPPGEIYENVGGYLRNVSDNVKKHSNELYADVKLRIDELTKVVEGQTEKSEKPSTKRESND